MGYAWIKGLLLIEPSVRGLCCKPYEGHPHGCPNFASGVLRCPPNAPLIGNVMSLFQDHYVVWNEFDLALHVAKMHARHPRWSRRQLFNCLYWQPTARKQLREEIDKLIMDRSWDGRKDVIVLTTPEACGVNVTETMKRIGIELEWPPRDKAYQVAVVGIAGGARGDWALKNINGF